MANSQVVFRLWNPPICRKSEIISRIGVVLWNAKSVSVAYSQIKLRHRVSCICSSSQRVDVDFRFGRMLQEDSRQFSPLVLKSPNNLVGLRDNPLFLWFKQVPTI